MGDMVHDDPLPARMAVAEGEDKPAKVEDNRKTPHNELPASTDLNYSPLNTASTDTLSSEWTSAFPCAPQSAPDQEQRRKSQAQAIAEAKQSTATLRKAALRLAVKIASKEESIEHMVRCLAKEQEETASAQLPRELLGSKTSVLLPIPSATQTSTKPLPQPPQIGAGTLSSSNFPLSTGTAITLALNDEVNALREAADSPSSLQLSLKTQATTGTGLLSPQQIDGKVEGLRECDYESEHASRRIRAGVKIARARRNDLRYQMNRLQDSRLTLIHQLNAATKSREEIEQQLGDANQIGEHVEAEMISTPYVKPSSDEDTKVLEFRLKAATELEANLEAQASTLKDRELSLSRELQESRTDVAKLKKELLLTHTTLSAIDIPVNGINVKPIELGFEEFESDDASMLTKSSQQSGNSSLKRLELSKLTHANSQYTVHTPIMVLPKSNGVAAETIEPHKLIEIAEPMVDEQQEKWATAAGVVGTEDSIQGFRPFKQYFADKEQESTDVVSAERSPDGQDGAHMLHKMRVTIPDSIPVQSMDDHKSGATKTTQTYASKRIKDSSEIGMVAAEACEVEIRQLNETRTILNQVLSSLRHESEELAALEQRYGSAAPAPVLQVESPSNLVGQTPFTKLESDLNAGQVKTMNPTIVTPSYEASSYPALENSMKRQRVKSVAGAIETLGHPSEAVPDVQTIPPQRKAPPPPIEIKVVARPTHRLQLHKAQSETALKTLRVLNQDRSYWRIGDISTIAGADDLPPHKKHRRSVSLCHDLGRRQMIDSLKQDDWTTSSQLLSPVSATCTSPFRAPDSLGRQVDSTTHEMPWTGRSPYYYHLSTDFEASGPLMASVIALAALSGPRANKALPPRPNQGYRPDLPRTVADKELPRIPRKPVNTVNKRHEQDSNHMYLLFPKARTEEALTIQRPMTATGYVSSMSFYHDADSFVEASSRGPTPEPRSIGMRALEVGESQTETMKPRKLSLRRSLSRLREKSKTAAAAPLARLAERSSSVTKRGLFRFHSQSTKGEDAERQQGNSTISEHSPSTTTSTESPTELFDSGIPFEFSRSVQEPLSSHTEMKDPVALHHAISASWLAPQRHASNQSGVYDPRIKKWILPSARVDSLGYSRIDLTMRKPPQTSPPPLPAEIEVRDVLSSKLTTTAIPEDERDEGFYSPKKGMGSTSPTASRLRSRSSVSQGASTTSMARSNSSNSSNTDSSADVSWYSCESQSETSEPSGY